MQLRMDTILYAAAEPCRPKPSPKTKIQLTSGAKAVQTVYTIHVGTTILCTKWQSFKAVVQ